MIIMMINTADNYKTNDPRQWKNYLTDGNRHTLEQN